MNYIISLLITLFVLITPDVFSQGKNRQSSLNYSISTEFTGEIQNGFDSVFVTLLTYNYESAAELNHLQVVVDKDTLVGFKELEAYSESIEEDTNKNSVIIRLKSEEPVYPVVFYKKEKDRHKNVFADSDNHISVKETNKNYKSDNFEPDSSRYLKGPKPLKPVKKSQLRH